MRMRLCRDGRHARTGKKRQQDAAPVSRSKIMHGSRRFHRQRLHPRTSLRRARRCGDCGRHARGQTAAGSMTMELRRPAERALEMKARFASAALQRRRSAPKRGGSAQATQAPAAATASRSRATPCWRRSDNNHPTPADGRWPAGGADPRRRTARSVSGSVPASGGSPRSSRCMWPNESDHLHRQRKQRQPRA